MFLFADLFSDRGKNALEFLNSGLGFGQWDGCCSRLGLGTGGWDFGGILGSASYISSFVGCSLASFVSVRDYIVYSHSEAGELVSA